MKSSWPGRSLHFTAPEKGRAAPLLALPGAARATGEGVRRQVDLVLRGAEREGGHLDEHVHLDTHTYI